MTSVAGFGGASLSAELMQMMDQIAREQRQDHRDAALHEADVALNEGFKEADDLRGQAANTMRGAIVGGTLSVAGGAAQAYSAAKMDVTPETPKPELGKTPGVDAVAVTGTGASATGVTTDAPIATDMATASPPAGADVSVAGEAQTPPMPTGASKTAAGSVNAEASKPPAPPGAGKAESGSVTGEAKQIGNASKASKAADMADGTGRGPWGAVSKAGETAIKAGEMAKGIFDGAGGYQAASAAEHRGRSQAASRRADAEQSDAQEAQKMSDKARELHQQILSLDHASRMAVLRG